MTVVGIVTDSLGYTSSRIPHFCVGAVDSGAIRTSLFLSIRIFSCHPFFIYYFGRSPSCPRIPVLPRDRLYTFHLLRRSSRFVPPCRETFHARTDRRLHGLPGLCRWRIREGRKFIFLHLWVTRGVAGGRGDERVVRQKRFAFVARIVSHSERFLHLGIGVFLEGILLDRKLRTRDDDAPLSVAYARTGSNLSMVTYWMRDERGSEFCMHRN